MNFFLKRPWKVIDQRIAYKTVENKTEYHRQRKIEPEKAGKRMAVFTFCFYKNEIFKIRHHAPHYKPGERNPPFMKRIERQNEGRMCKSKRQAGKFAVKLLKK
jgi:hypothetical protein